MTFYPSPPASKDLSSSASQALNQEEAKVLAEQLAYRLTITSGDWHRLKANRQARALEQMSVALVYLLNNQTEEALARLNQATGWLDRSISAPPCPTHGHLQSKPQSNF